MTNNDQQHPGRTLRNAAKTCLALFALCGITAPLNAAREDEPAIRFNRDILPILSNHCFQCHGPDSAQRKAGLRLDDGAKALLPAESGGRAIVPGQPDDSELVHRIRSDDPNEIMPPPAANKPLTPEQKALLTRWISSGAVYEPHWAFIPPQRPELPAVKQAEWPRNAIDVFILARLEQAALRPSIAADTRTLFRRLSLDLTGLPPDPADVRAFTGEMAASAAQSTAAADQTYLRWVDRLLASPHFGERMAVDWLDVARFADSNGYQVDRDREMYAWRDWVIAAFNANQPFDQFTVEQIAGDLLPDATIAQKIATGFHRNHMLNEEGGIIPAEFLAEYCADRVETTATVWLGQTFNCARCHDHKFDAFTQRDFYSLYAFFHNVAEQGVGNYGANIRRNAPPFIKLPAPELDARIAALRAEQAEEQTRLKELDAAIAARQPGWEDRLRTAPIAWQPASVSSAMVDQAPYELGEDRQVLRLPALAPGSHAVAIEALLPLKQAMALLLEARAVQANDNDPTPAVQLTQWRVLRPEAGGKPSQPVVLRAAEVEGAVPAAEAAKALDPQGKTVSSLSGKAGASTLVVEFDPLVTEADAIAVRLEFSLRNTEQTAPWELRLSTALAEPELLAPAGILAVVRKDAKERTPAEARQLVDFLAAKNSDRRLLTERLAALAKQIEGTDLAIPTALIMEDLAMPRPTHILIRGEYTRLGEAVSADTPRVLPPLAEGLPRNRLGLARWLVDPANPLTARVTVNRFWQSLFGTGLVRTAEDFGTQGEAASHPELLDWLATEFVSSGWDVKALLRLMVTSATYRQSSRLSPLLLERDPDNRLLARGPRFRLQAEFLRDQALAASGLLVRKIGGPSVKPYHPPGLYEQVTAGNGTNVYVEGKGEDLYRRSMYTYWKRSVPHPSMLVFDATFREACTVRRPRTNTPLQALNLMNDPTYVEAARRLAERTLREGGDTTGSRLAWLYWQMLARPPHPAEAAVLTRAFERALQSFQAEPAAASDLLKVGATQALSDGDPIATAAWTTVADTILNLDEMVMKE